VHDTNERRRWQRPAPFTRALYICRKISSGPLVQLRTAPRMPLQRPALMDRDIALLELVLCPDKGPDAPNAGFANWGGNDGFRDMASNTGTEDQIAIREEGATARDLLAESLRDCVALPASR
jgi:hypothetical protein